MLAHNPREQTPGWMSIGCDATAAAGQVGVPVIAPKCTPEIWAGVQGYGGFPCCLSLGVTLKLLGPELHMFSNTFFGVILLEFQQLSADSELGTIF